MQEHKLRRMKIEFNIKRKIKKQEVFDKLKKVLFLSMLKMEELAIINVPVDTGRLKVSINVNPRVLGYSSYILGTGVIYAAAVEFGTGPRVIVPVSKKALAFKMDGKKVIVKKVMHPGSEARPFMRPSLDQVKNIWVKKYFKREFSK